MNTFAAGWIGVASLLGMVVQNDTGRVSQDKESPKPQEEAAVLQLPLKGVMADCCLSPIEQGLKGIKNLRSAKIRKTDDRYIAEITMKDGEGLPLSEARKALDTANETMGKAMGTKYEVDGTLSSSAVHFYRTGSAPDEAALKKALSSLKGFKGVWVKKSGFAAQFSGATAPSMEEVAKASGMEPTEVILAPAVQGKRYACPMHPEKVSVAATATCPVCGMAMVEVAPKE